MVYCDTDSIKTLGPVDINRINGERMKRAQISGGVARDRKGQDHYIGIFEYEGTYHRFVSCGAKRYAYIEEGCPRSEVCKTWPLCKMCITVSGVQSKIVNEKTGIPFAVEELGCLENFKEGMTWVKAGGIAAVYNDHDDFIYTDPASGKQLRITSNVALVPSTYEMTFETDYKKILYEFDLYGEYMDRRE